MIIVPLIAENENEAVLTAEDTILLRQQIVYVLLAGSVARGV